MARIEGVGLWVALVTAGCSNATADDGPYWWQVETDATESDGFEDEDGEDFDDEREPGQFFWAETDLEEGYAGFVDVNDAAEIRCELEYTLDPVAEVEDCAPCSRAFSMTAASVEIYDEIADGCADHPYATLEGQSFRIGGVGGGAVYIDAGDGWVAVEDSFAELEGEWMYMRMNVGTAGEQ